MSYHYEAYLMKDINCESYVVYLSCDTSSDVYQEIASHYKELQIAVKSFNSGGYFPIDFKIVSGGSGHQLFIQFPKYKSHQFTYYAQLRCIENYNDFLCIMRSFVRHIPTQYLNVICDKETRHEDDLYNFTKYIHYRPVNLQEYIRTKAESGYEQVQREENNNIRYNLATLSHDIEFYAYQEEQFRFNAIVSQNGLTTYGIVEEMLYGGQKDSITLPDNVSRLNYGLSSEEYDQLIKHLEKVLRHVRSEAKRKMREREPLLDYVNPKNKRYPGVRRIFSEINQILHSDEDNKPSCVIESLSRQIKKGYLLNPYISEDKPFLYGEVFFKRLKEFTRSDIKVESYSRLARQMMLG